MRSNRQSSVASASFTVVPAQGLRHDPERLPWNIARTYTLTPGRRYSFGCRHRLGTASNLAMYVSAADNNYVGVTGTFWSTARLDFSSCTSEPSAGPSPRWCSSRRARWTCTACRSGPAPSRETRSQ